MSGQKFKAGDLVQLKSGGPQMVVEKFGGYGHSDTYLCTWFSGAKHNSNHFAEEALKLYEDMTPTRIETIIVYPDKKPQ